MLNTVVLILQVFDLFLLLKLEGLFLLLVDKFKVILLPFQLYPLLFLDKVGIGLVSSAFIPLVSVGALHCLLALYHSVVVPLQLLN